MPPTPSAARPTDPAPPPKHCGCGQSHDAYEWLQLRRIGVQDDAYTPLELRDCSCTSTLAVALCSVSGCGCRAVYMAEDERAFCATHEREWHLMTDDREDVGDEWAAEERRARDLEWAR